MRNRLTRIGTPEKAREILLKLQKQGKLTLEDIDQESNHAAYNREIAEKYFPKIKLNPHRNLLRDDVSIQQVRVTEDRDFSPAPRPSPEVQGIDPLLLLHEVQEDNPPVDLDNLQW